MAQQLKVFALGGLNEIGKNMYVYEYAGEIIIVDCGVAFLMMICSALTLSSRT